MNNALIKIAYRQIIDSRSDNTFERNVFNDSYDEFLMQIQAYNQENKYKTWNEITTHVPKSASLHYKVGFAVGLYVKDLKNQIPGLKDPVSRIHLSFNTCEFEIIESDIADRSVHKIALIYTTDTITLYRCIGDYMVLSLQDSTTKTPGEEEKTFLLRMQPNMSIVHYREI